MLLLLYDSLNLVVNSAVKLLTVTGPQVRIKEVESLRCSSWTVLDAKCTGALSC